MKKETSAVFFLFLCLSWSVAQSHTRQEDALGRLYKANLQGKAGIDNKLCDEIKIIDETRVLSQKGLKEKDLIKKLPGQPHVEFTQYGGYVTVDESAGRALYYYFVESEHSKHSKPLLLWLNGGPGASSIGYGAMEELGPFRPHSDGKTLYKNRYAWNKVANVLFLESPAGVGFSYSNRSSDYSTGDGKTAADNYLFLVNWLERFPEYKTRDFYIAGESYAGHYVPQLAHTIIHHNKMRKKNFINLKGILIGNALINDGTDRKGRYEFLWSHALISDETAHRIQKYCDFSPNATTETEQCLDANHEAIRRIRSIDNYNIYAPLCLSNLTAKPKKTSPLTIDPCIDDYVYAYLNRLDVQEALHANVTKLSYDWEPLSYVLAWEDRRKTIIPFLQEVMANGLRVWVYSGDTDASVPVTSTRYSLNEMKLPVRTSWYPWFVNREVGGYTVVYKGDLTFVTVRGAGHMVPSYQPVRALALVKYFLDGKPLPKKMKSKK